MKCKNCEANLRTDFVFCPSCGAKATVRRITFKTLLADIYERVLNLDNTFFRTFRNLTLRPEMVIGSYMEGVRRRFLNPFNYLGVALALSGISFFVMKNRVDKISLDIMGARTDTIATRKIMEISMEYHAFIFLLYIPIIALAGYLTFNTRNYNLPEHVVSACYSLSHFSILMMPVSIFVLLANPGNYMVYSFAVIGLMFVYTLYVLIRLHTISGWILTLIRGIAYFFLFCIGYFGLSITINIIMLLTGVVELQDYLPQEP